MDTHRFLFCALLLTSTVTADIYVDWKIVPPPNSNTVNLDNLGQAAAAQGATGIVSVDKNVVEKLTAEMCQPGTYSQIIGTDQLCIPCPAGTASPAYGASDPSTCLPCATGAYSRAQASVCTDCVADTFSVTLKATVPDVCLQCPPESTSPSRSSSVEMCICDEGTFLSENVMRAFPYDAVPVEMSLLGVTGIDIPHVTC